ncbi:hypothetical protein AB9P05_06585 [Roseivirga sp. BDSF3-8]|uniref:hypothetical protein n=1 Tax=Roseivirga sp. BDSF3-8 TaxID=3241598 RepID=UPI00353180C7
MNSRKTHSEGEAKQKRRNSEPEAKDKKGEWGVFFWGEGFGEFFQYGKSTKKVGALQWWAGRA